MKRDPELIREILLNIEAHPDWVVPNVTAKTDYTSLMGHVKILQDAGYLAAEKTRAGGLRGYRLTWEGHEFVDKVRDPEIWRKTKSSAEKLGSWTVKLLGEMAAGFLRQKAADLGLPIAP